MNTYYITGHYLCVKPEIQANSKKRRIFAFSKRAISQFHIKKIFRYLVIYDNKSVLTCIRHCLSLGWIRFAIRQKSQRT